MPQVKFTIEYTGPIVSLNDYKSKSWRVLRNKVKQVEDHFAIRLFQARPKRLAWFELRVRHNTNLDMDNVTGMIKPCVDVMRHKNVIPDDNKRNWDYLSISHDPKLPKNQILFEITGETILKSNPQ